MVEAALPRVMRTAKLSYETLAQLQRNINLCPEDITLQFSPEGWIDVNLMAVIGALGFAHERNGYKLAYDVEPTSSFHELLERNSFFTQKGYHLDRPDLQETTVSYREFNVLDKTDFYTYITSELLSKRNMPDMSDGLKAEINRSMSELFSNTELHSGSHEAFVCGQEFPVKQQIAFTYVDLGTRTIRHNVERKLGQAVGAARALAWAVCYGNTTRTEGQTGGLGLSLIIDFLKSNGGEMHIVSDAGFFELRADGIQATSTLREPFQGTIVSLIINTNDANYHTLKEFNRSEIF